MSGGVATLTLVTAVFAGDAVMVDYTALAGESAARLQDEAGNAAASFSGRDVTNDTQDADPLTASAHGVPAAHDGSTTSTFELRFRETPRRGFSYKTLRDQAFTVTGGEVVKARRLEQGKNVNPSGGSKESRAGVWRARTIEGRRLSGVAPWRLGGLFYDPGPCGLPRGEKVGPECRGVFPRRDSGPRNRPRRARRVVLMVG